MTGQVSVDDFVEYLGFFTRDCVKNDFVKDGCRNCALKTWKDVARVLKVFTYDAERKKCLEDMWNQGALDRIAEGDQSKVVECFTHDGYRKDALRVLSKHRDGTGPRRTVEDPRHIANCVLAMPRIASAVLGKRPKPTESASGAPKRGRKVVSTTNVFQGKGSTLTCVGVVNKVTDGKTVKWEGPGIGTVKDVVHHSDTAVSCVDDVHTVKCGADSCTIEKLSEPPKDDE